MICSVTILLSVCSIMCVGGFVFVFVCLLLLLCFGFVVVVVVPVIVVVVLGGGGEEEVLLELKICFHGQVGSLFFLITLEFVQEAKSCAEVYLSTKRLVEYGESGIFTCCFMTSEKDTLYCSTYSSISATSVFINK